MAQVPNGRLVKGQYEPICMDCAMYFSITVDVTIFEVGWTKSFYSPEESQFPLKINGSKMCFLLK